MYIPYNRKNLEWRPVEGTSGDYYVSNYGDLWVKEKYFVDKANRRIHRKEHIIWVEDMSRVGGSKKHGRRAYAYVCLNNIKEYSHRLAAKAFIPNPYNKEEVNHIDGNTINNYCGCKENNYMDSNLEWVTKKENSEHASRTGLINKDSELRKIQCAKNREKIDYEKLSRKIVQINPTTGDYITEYPSIMEAYRQTKIGHSTIQSVASHDGYHKTAGGFGWIYKDEYDPTKDNRVVVDRGSGNRMAVKQLSLDGNIIREYSSPMEAERLNKEQKFNNKYIRDCCHGKRQTHKGFRWEFV